MSTELEVKRLEEDISPIIFSAREILVSTPDQYSGAASFLKELKSAQKKVIEYWGPLKKKAHEAWKGITAKEKEMIEPLTEAEQEIKYKMITFRQEEEEKKRKEQQRLQAIEEARAEKERQKLLKQAERLKTPELKEQRLQEAQEVETPVVTVNPIVPKIKGQSFSKTWKARVINKRALVEAALKDANLFSFIEVDLSRLNRFACNSKGRVKYAGIEFYKETTMASRGSSEN